MTDTARIKSDLSYNVVLQSDNRMQLFIDWLNRLILLHEVEHIFLNTFQAHVLTGSPWSLNALVKGQKIEEGVERRLHVKSATYGQLQWRETPQGHQVEFVVDV
jgi:SHS2 domain-containing protein